MSLSDIFREIEAERVCQIEVKGHTPEADDALSPERWLAIICRWAVAACNCGLKGRPDLVRIRMVEVATIAVAAIESEDRKHSHYQDDRQSAEIANSAVGQGDVPPAMPEPPIVSQCLSSVG